MHAAVSVPKMTYMADVWYTPVYSMAGNKRKSGVVGFSCRMATVQRLASVAIMGALRTTATDVLDMHANLLPVNLLLHTVCHRLAGWLASLPSSHPLSPVFWVWARWWVKPHKSP